jgi:hypothetical protein
MYDQAVEKLKNELKSGTFDRYGSAMKQDVCGALIEFCRQDEEFSQAVVQGGSFADCMKAVAKKVHGSAISDMEAYGEAVRFFFPGAGIDVKMTVDLCASVKDSAPAPESEKKSGVVLDLSDFF